MYSAYFQDGNTSVKSVVAAPDYEDYNDDEEEDEDLDEDPLLLEHLDYVPRVMLLDNVTAEDLARLPRLPVIRQGIDEFMSIISINKGDILSRTN